MVNRVTLIGNLGRDPEVRQAGQTSVCTLSVATSERQKKGDQWEEVTEWHRVVVFGKSAENCGRYLAKGRTVYVDGRLRTNKWQDKDGKDRYTTEIIANDIRFLGGGDKSAPASQEDRPHRDTRSQAAPPSADDDVPF